MDGSMFRHSLFTLLLCLGGVSLASAASLTINGTASYEINSHGGVLTLSAGEISNNSNGGHSGSMKWALWATESRYSGGGISGYILGEYQFDDVLQGGYYYSTPEVTVAYTPPPDGVYYITMTLSEYSGSEFVIRDVRTFDDTEQFGTGGGGGGALGGGVPNTTALGNNWYSSLLFGDFVVTGGGWNYCDWFGSFYPNVVGSQVWIYSLEWEWCYIESSASASSNWWCWIDSYSDWAWTTTSYYPSTYLNNVGSWCYYDSGVGDFYNNTTNGYLGGPGGGSGGGGSGGGGYTVDYILTNTGGLDQASWNQFVQTYSSALQQYGYDNFYQYSFTSNKLIMRYDVGDAATAAEVRSALQPLVGDYGGFRIDVE